MTKYLIGNQKMLMNPFDVEIFLKDVCGSLNDHVVLCPSSIYIPYYLKHEFKVGVQNVFYEKSGAYTGEISPIQAKSMGVSFCIIGHSERRNICHEEASEIQKKVALSLNCGLQVILCIGETLEERSLKKTEFVLRQQLYQALAPLKDLSGLWIAYEPLWAIGTGKTADVEEIDRIALFIKKTIAEYKEVDDIPILYGGSVNSSNIGNIAKVESIQGFLVGGASTKALEFLKMKEVVAGQ